MPRLEKETERNKNLLFDRRYISLGTGHSQITSKKLQLVQLQSFPRRNPNSPLETTKSEKKPHSAAETGQVPKSPQKTGPQKPPRQTGQTPYVFPEASPSTALVLSSPLSHAETSSRISAQTRPDKHNTSRPQAFWPRRAPRSVYNKHFRLQAFQWGSLKTHERPTALPPTNTGSKTDIYQPGLSQHTRNVREPHRAGRKKKEEKKTRSGRRGPPGVFSSVKGSPPPFAQSLPPLNS